MRAAFICSVTHIRKGRAPGREEAGGVGEVISRRGAAQPRAPKAGARVSMPREACAQMPISYTRYLLEGRAPSLLIAFTIGQLSSRT